MISWGMDMQLLINVLGDIIHFFSIVIICSLFFKFDIRKGKHQRIRQIVIALIMIAISVYSNITKYDSIVIIYVSSIIFLTCSLYKEKIGKIIVISVWIIFILSILYFMLRLLIDNIISLLGVYSSEFSFLITSILALLFVLFCGLYYNKTCKISVKHANIGNLVMFSLIAVADALMVALVGSTIQELYIDNIPLIVVFCMFVLGIFFQLTIVIILYVQRSLYMEEKKLTQKYLNEQKNHYEYLELRERETKKFRHDMRNHMQMLSTFIRNKDYIGAEEYFAQIDEKIRSFGNLITVHNGIVDAVINQYYSMAQQKNIDMDVNGRFPANCGIDAYDLCTVFSNILSNAIESAEQADEKKISLNCRYTDNNIIVVAKNTFKDAIQFDVGRLKTSKKDVNHHGFGLENIRDCVKKNNGMINIEIEENQFVITVLLNYEDVENDKNCNN